MGKISHIDLYTYIKRQIEMEFVRTNKNLFSIDNG